MVRKLLIPCLGQHNAQMTPVNPTLPSSRAVGSGSKPPTSVLCRNVAVPAVNCASGVAGVVDEEKPAPTPITALPVNPSGIVLPVNPSGTATRVNPTPVVAPPAPVTARPGDPAPVVVTAVPADPIPSAPLAVNPTPIAVQHVEPLPTLVAVLPGNHVPASVAALHESPACLPVNTAPVPTTTVPVNTVPKATVPPNSAPLSAVSVATAPILHAPVNTTPVTALPVDTAPIIAAYVDSAPITALPLDTAPITAAPVDTTPVTAAPMNTTPITAVPVNSQSITAAPVNAISITAAPVNAISITAAPVDTAPITAAPVDTTPVTAAPMHTTTTALHVDTLPTTAEPVNATSITAAPVDTGPTTAAPGNFATHSVNTAPVATHPVNTAPIPAATLPMPLAPAADACGSLLNHCQTAVVSNVHITPSTAPEGRPICQPAAVQRTSDDSNQVRAAPPRRSLLGLVASAPQTQKLAANTGPQPDEDEPDADAVSYKVFYTKQKKKHKTYQSGIFVVRPKRTLLFTDAGKQVTVFTTKKSWMAIGEGESIGWVRDYLIEVDVEFPFTEYMSGRVFLCGMHAPSTAMKENCSLPEPPRKRARTSITGLAAAPLGSAARSIVSRAPPPPMLCPAEVYNVHMLEAPDVYIDSFLASKLQKHQVAGVEFLYRSFRQPSGAILADGMGLGKTMQALCFLWVILSKKSQGRSLAKKAVIVTPSSLCGSWMLETKKWMDSRLKPTLVTSSNPEQTIRNFCSGKSTVNDHLLIISYDFLRRFAKLLSHVDVLVCDEGHRMSHDSGATKALRKVGKVRIVLTGTPLQNNLDELFTLCDFVCPGKVADWNVFKKAIMRSRDPDATEEEKRLGDARAQQLDEVTKSFLLRRTTEMLDLPPKNVFLIFLPFNDAREYTEVLNEGCSNPLGTLQKLRKICFLSKMPVLQQFLQQLWAEMPNEKIVLVSSFTTCLDSIEQMLKEFQLPYTRLDGSTATKDRQPMVDRWNTSTERMVFLLSSRAGGCGLNMQQGGRRMVIVDPDWNPANDLQVMGRLWRMGQKREVFIYRLCMAGSVEEKILQRQELKVDLAALAIDGKSKVSASNWDDLRQLFRLEGIVDNRTASLSSFVRERMDKLQPVSNAVLAPWGPYVGTADEGKAKPGEAVAQRTEMEISGEASQATNGGDAVAQVQPSQDVCMLPEAPDPWAQGTGVDPWAGPTVDPAPDPWTAGCEQAVGDPQNPWVAYQGTGAKCAFPMEIDTQTGVFQKENSGGNMR